MITLDDGTSRNFQRNAEAQAIPLPYLASSESTRALRVGDHLTFTHPTVLGFTFDQWSLQPTTPIDGTTSRDQLPVSWEESRAQEVNGPENVGGDLSLASFNVLNYFTSLGEDEAGCRSYNDRNGHPVTANGCRIRGAYTQSAFDDQQSKIVSAINTLDASVLGLEEIENSAHFTGDRDDTLNHLVGELNAAGGHWEAVASPQQRPDVSNEDVIRTAFIYNPDKVTPVGESRILDSGEFTGVARQPLAQEFRPAGGGESFVVVVNHFKSKGSVAHGDADRGDGQGNNAALRAAQAKALVMWLGEQDDWKNTAQFIIGDLNSYAKEDSIKAIERAGFTNLEEHYDAGNSYLFGGRVGSLDHVLANEQAMAMSTGADVWNINAMESIAYEYSRRGSNAVDFFAPDVFRASDHDPIKVGIQGSGQAPDTTEPGTGNTGHGHQGQIGSNQGSTVGSAT